MVFKRGAAQKMRYADFKSEIIKKVGEEITALIRNYADWKIFLREDEDEDGFVENYIVIADTRKDGWYVAFCIDDCYTENYLKDNLSVEEIASSLTSVFISMAKLNNMVDEK